MSPASDPHDRQTRPIKLYPTRKVALIGARAGPNRAGSGAWHLGTGPTEESASPLPPGPGPWGGRWHPGRVRAVTILGGRRRPVAPVPGPSNGKKRARTPGPERPGPRSCSVRSDRAANLGRRYARGSTMTRHPGRLPRPVPPVAGLTAVAGRPRPRQAEPTVLPEATAPAVAERLARPATTPRTWPTRSARPPPSSARPSASSSPTCPSGDLKALGKDYLLGERPPTPTSPARPRPGRAKVPKELFFDARPALRQRQRAAGRLAAGFLRPVPRRRQGIAPPPARR